MRDSWQFSKITMSNIGEYLSFRNGQAIPEYAVSGYPIYGSNGFLGYCRQGNAKKNSVVIGRVGAYCGSLVFLTDESWVTDNAIIAEPRNGTDGRYLFYLLSTLSLREFAGGSAQPLLNQTTLSLVPCQELPPLRIQQRVANILGAFDDKIELNRKMNKTLEQMAQVLYKNWFVDFGPFKDGEFVESELGRIPKGWRVQKLCEIANILMGQSPPSKFYNKSKNGLPFHQGVSNFGIRFPKHEVFCIELFRVAEAGSILFSVRAPVGRINVADQEIVIGRGLAALNHRGGKNSFLLYMLKAVFAEEDRFGSGTIFNQTTKKELESFRVLAPPDEIMSKFNEETSKYDEQIQLNEKENETLRETRDYLLPKLMSGDVDIKVAKKELSRAV